MSLTTGEMTPADLAAVTGNNNGLFGGEGSWFVIILFLFAFLGWGNGGLGNGNTNSGAAENYVLASDFATLQRQIDAAADRLGTQNVAISNGLCDGFYTQAQLVNGVQQNLATQGYETRNAITQAQINEMQNSNTIQSQIASCCCQNREAIAGVNYNMATNAASLQNAITSGFCSANYSAATNTRDIIDNQNSNARAILDAINAQTLAAKDEKIAEQAQAINALQLAASQAAQNNYLVNALRPSPIPAYSVANPYSYSTTCPYST